MNGLEPGGQLAWIAGGWVVALLLLWAWWRGVRFVRLLKDLPTVRIRGIFVGLVETTGRVTCAAPVQAGISSTTCVHHAWSVCEHWRRVETYTDSKGRTQTRVVTGSDTVAQGGESIDFVLQDETGRIPIRVGGADWRPRVTVYEYVGRNHPLYYTKAPNATVSGSTGMRTYSENLVAVNDDIYVVASAAVAQEGSTLELLRDRADDDMLILSTGDEKSVARGRLGWAVAAYIVGLLAAAAGGAGAFTVFEGISHGPNPEQAQFAAGAVSGAVLFALIALVMWMVIMRNGVVRVRTRWQRAVSLVDVELKRRSDLVPNVVAVTEGFSVHERTVQESMAKLRAGAAAAGVLAALVEAYPNLKADASFLKLQDELTTTEDRIALARGFELESRKAFLERLRTFPEGTVARVFGVAAPPPELGDRGAEAGGAGAGGAGAGGRGAGGRGAAPGAGTPRV